MLSNEELCMRILNRRNSLVFALVAMLATMFFSAKANAQGGEPRQFAIRGAKVVPVSGPPIENATVLISHGLITAVGKDLTIPDEAWIIDGKGLVVYPGLFDAFTDVGLVPAAAPAGGENAGPRGRSQGKPRYSIWQATARVNWC
jgi:hypothetical protein